jgi:hypothetical protein
MGSALFSFRLKPSKHLIASKTTLDDTTKIDTSNLGNPILGYRFIIEGDFDGDGKKEKLVEHYFSKIDNQESPKYYENSPEYGDFVFLVTEKKPFSFVLSDNPKIDTLIISDNPQLLGLAFMKNEGDLNGDGTDEISFVIDWADWTNLNTWQIYTYQDKKWKSIYSFPIWEFQLPDLPATFNQYGLFGTESKGTISPDCPIVKEQVEALKNFKGLVEKVKTKVIKVTYRTDDAEEKVKKVRLK